MRATPAVGRGTETGAAHEGYACARAWAALTAAHARIAGRLGAELAASCGLSLHEFDILLWLGQVPPPGARLGELRAAVPLTQPALSRAVARLAQRGWLSRAGAAEDRRAIRIMISEAGREVLRRAVPVHAATIAQELLDPLTPGERDVLAQALGRVAAGQARPSAC